MKTILKLCLLILAVVLSACQKDTPGDPYVASKTLWGDIETVDGWIAKPEWLVGEMEKVAERHSLTLGIPLYPHVYLVRYNGQDYIALVDLASGPFSGSLFDIYMYFKSSGEYVEARTANGDLSPMYDYLEEERRVNATLIWNPGMALNRGKSGSTRADSSSGVYTPRGTEVPYYQYDFNVVEKYDTPAEVEALRTEMRERVYSLAYESPNEWLAPPSSRYNCHGYAWHMSEGGDAVWMNFFPQIYLDDGSYVRVPSESATPGAKVLYGPLDDHSAVLISGDIFQSKWGKYDLMRHHKDQTPYDSSVLKYYEIFNPSKHLYVTGPKTLLPNSSGTFSIPPYLPTGATFLGWTVSIATSSTSTNFVTTSPLTYNFTTAGHYTIKAEFIVPGGGRWTATTGVTVGTPPPPPPPTPPATPYIVGDVMWFSDPEPPYNRDVCWLPVGQTKNFYVQNPESGAVYEWRCDEAIIYVTQTVPNISISAAGMAQGGFYPLMCRVLKDNYYSPWSTVYLYVSSFPPSWAAPAPAPSAGPQEDESDEEPEAPLAT